MQAKTLRTDGRETPLGLDVGLGERFFLGWAATDGSSIGRLFQQCSASGNLDGSD